MRYAVFDVDIHLCLCRYC